MRSNDECCKNVLIPLYDIKPRVTCVCVIYLIFVHIMKYKLKFFIPAEVNVNLKENVFVFFILLENGSNLFSARINLGFSHVLTLNHFQNK